MRNRVLNKQSGFTLIEVLIAVTILATISIVVAQSIKQGLKAKTKIQEQIENLGQLREALRLMEKDVNLAFHYRDIELEISALLKKKPQPPSTTSPGGTPPPPIDTTTSATTTTPEVTRIDPTTHFVGTDSEMNFVTMNSSQFLSSEAQADFVEVGYKVSDCRSFNGKGGNGKCLWRRTSAVVDSDVTEGGTSTVVLENVEEFKLRYFGKGKQDWNSSWRSDSGGDLVTKGAYPELVEVSITTRPPSSLSSSSEGSSNKGRKYSMQIVMAVHNPNNPTEEEKKRGP